MCVMEVRVGQRSTTIAQAMAHNIKTIVSDLEMFEHVLAARKDEDHSAAIAKMRTHLQIAYQTALDVFGYEIAEDHAMLPEPIGNENPRVDPHDLEIALAAIARAHPYETR